MGTRVVVGLSGGVDSSVSALLLRSCAQKLNLDVHGVFMHNWDTEGQMCPTASRDYQDALKTASQLGIPLSTVNLTKEYWTRVFEPMIESLENGETPNPDIGCNRWIKFGAFADLMLNRKPGTEYNQLRARIMEEIEKCALSPDPLPLPKPTSAKWNPTPSITTLIGTADFIVTGHYARIGLDPILSRPVLKRALDRKKDQTYFLSTISHTSLQQTIFPLGNLQKPQVKQIAARNGLDHVSKKRESMGICFIEPGEKFGDFVGGYIDHRPGNFVTMDGEVVGRHDGVARFTVGQGARISGAKGKWFVSGKDVDTGNVTVVPGSTHPALYRDSIQVRDWVWIDAQEPTELSTNKSMKGMLKIRHQSEPVPVKFRSSKCLTTEYSVYFEGPQLGIASGQHAALYSTNDICLGGGKIK
ncbi:5-methylaminomethyl-2-thiouridylate-methyltransferase [Rhizoclosmatium globosum]|uniref:tRNA-5-taurinomethyluridine 2-sulfurtransferase n=1 Tax=Rhizoclosmatium globosum TaxID=329046 RepID=A0A1Y2CU38_9FUNG|nr:5-methylaminomethyl-2-thiouridylate-methyltransferase [Rhizoclosmatium globosum]|eukprot:ORY50477.1 5-methylaminomethyl-2-thiouridylate-methyltransferase [Rhizoclosmatium globosum]